MSQLRLFTSESVTEGHPDKICDQISDAILDEMLRQDPDARVAVETMVTTGLVHVAGEVRTSGYVDIPRVVRDTIIKIGYDSSEKGFDGRFGPGLPRVSDGSLLFLQHMLSHMAPVTETNPQGSRVGIVLSGSPLFSGQAESGESDLPGEGLGSKTEPVTDKLSALIEVMNEKFGADLDESDKLVFEQTRMDIMRREDLRIIAEGNDREHYRLALADEVDDLIASRGNRNAQLFDAYYARPEIRDAFIDFVSDTWKEFRAEHE